VYHLFALVVVVLCADFARGRNTELRSVRPHLPSAHCAFFKRNESTLVGKNNATKLAKQFSVKVANRDKKHAFSVYPQAPPPNHFHHPDGRLTG